MGFKWASAVESVNVSGSPIIFTPGGSAVAGEQLVAFFNADGTSMSVITPPSGWTVLTDAAGNAGVVTNVDGETLVGYQKLASGSETASDYTFACGSGLAMAACLCFSNRDAGALVMGFYGQVNLATGSPLDITLLSLTLPSLCDVLIFGGLDQTSDVAWDFVGTSGFTTRVASNSASGDYSNIGAATQDAVGIGAIGVKVARFTTAGADMAGGAALILGIPTTGGGSPPAGILRQMMQYQG